MDSEELKRKFPVGSYVKIVDVKPANPSLLSNGRVGPGWNDCMTDMCGKWNKVISHNPTSGYLHVAHPNGTSWSFPSEWITDQSPTKPVVLHPAPLKTLTLPKKPQVNLAPKTVEPEKKVEKETGLATIFGAAAMAIFGLGAAQVAAKKIMAKKEEKEEVVK